LFSFIPSLFSLLITSENHGKHTDQSQDVATKDSSSSRGILEYA
jgi:hypothetical protein